MNKPVSNYITAKLRMEHLQRLYDTQYSSDWFTYMRSIVPGDYTRRQFRNDLTKIWRSEDAVARAMTAKADGLWQRIRNIKDKA